MLALVVGEQIKRIAFVADLSDFSEVYRSDQVSNICRGRIMRRVGANARP